MSFFQKLQKKEFWDGFLKITIPFFILLVLISLFMNSWRDIVAGDFAAVNEYNFSEGKWMRFWGIKIVITILYGLFMANKNVK
ncbi:MAG: hypothetical protein CMB99_02330 [Flavobacteriaceae bacterium]|nr:hypothetical protein [Flavobacteriaceae bacterium]|tara:strand:- start:33160 stop:33408 length:249 start_codon:yes stop_codon:yes gene_type:complete